MKKILASLVLLLTLSTVAAAQTLPTNRAISTSGVTCAVATACAFVDVRDMVSVGVNLDVAASGTFQFEASMDATNINNGTWFSVSDDVNGASSATADGRFYFSNPGYRFLRVRASAISGTAAIVFAEGKAGLKSTATLAGGAAGDGAILDGSNATIKATVLSLASSKPLASAIVDASGNQITSFGGGTQYTEDAAAAADPIGTMNIARRRDTLTAAEVSTDGDNIAVNATAKGEVYVKQTDPVPATQSGTWNITNVSGTVSLPTGAATAAKQPALGTAGAASTDVITVQGIASGTPQPISGSISCSNCSGTGVSVNEDAASANGDPGTPAYAVRQDTISNLTSTDGDYAPLKVDAVGRLYTTGSGGTFPITAASLPLPTGASTLAEQQTQTTALQIIDNLPVAQGSTTSGQSGVLIQGAVTTGAPTYTTAQTAPLSLDTTGALRVSGSAAGTQYTEDAAAAADPVGTAVNLVRKDTPSATVSADGDNIAQRGSNFGAAYVTVLDSGGNFIAPTTLAQVDTALGTITNVTGSIMMGRSSTATPSDTSADDDAAALLLDRKGRARIVCDSGCSGGTQFAEDAAAASGDSGTLSLAVRQDTISSSTSTDGDYGSLKINSVGRLYASATIDAALPAGANAIGTVTTVGGAASGAAKSGNPVQTGGVFNTTQPTVTTGQVVEVQSTARGAQIVATGVDAFAVTANAGTNLNTSALALETGGNLATVASAVRAEDTASADADKGITAFAVRKATPANTSGTDGDYEALQISAGRLWASTNIDSINGVAPLMGSGSTGTGSLRVTVSTDQLPMVGFGVYAEDAAETAGGNLVMSGSVRRDTPASSAGSSGDNATLNTSATGALYTQPIAGTVGGATPGFYISAASNNSTNLKASAGTVYSFSVINTTAALKYIRFYDLASAPTCTSATGIVFYTPIPAATTGAGMVYTITIGKAFSTGIGWCITGGAGTTDNTSTAAGDVVLNYDWK